MFNVSIDDLSNQELTEYVICLEAKKANIVSLYAFLDKMEPKNCMFVDTAIFKIIMNMSTLISDIKEKLEGLDELQKPETDNQKLPKE